MNRIAVAQELVKLARELTAVETDESTGWPVVHGGREIPSSGTPFIGLLHGKPNLRQILKEVPFKKGLNKREPVYIIEDGVFRMVKTNEDMDEQRIFTEPMREYTKALRRKE
jgi:hypothetical protein